jgi:SAM-dependent methyltransferase
MRRTPYELTACPVCGSTESVEIADRDAIMLERERLWEFHGRRLRDGIPPERLMDRVAFSQDPPLRLVRCRSCAHIYRNPREREEALGAAYDADAPEEVVLQKLFDTQRQAYAAQARRLKQIAGDSGSGLEVGSYAGGFLAAARDAGWDFQGADISARAAGFAAQNGFVVTRGGIETVVVARPLDAVVIWNTFEQLHDSRSAVAAARALLRKGGTFVVRVPNGRFYERWRARLDGPLSGIAERVLVHNNLLTFPYQQGFSRRSLGRLLAERDFQVVHVFGDTLVPIADEWTTTLGRAEERIVKRLQQSIEHGWHAPWVEVYARAT